MTKEIWLPDSETHVVVQDGKIKIWDSMIMTKTGLTKSTFGFDKDKKDEE